MGHRFTERVPEGCVCLVDWIMMKCSYTCGHVQEMGADTASEHSEVEVQCHQRRARGNWHSYTPLGPVEIGTILVENNLASHIEAHQSAHTRWLTHFWECIPR